MGESSKVVIADFFTDALEPEREALGEIADVVALDGHSEDDVAGRIDDADAVMLYHSMSLTDRTIETLTNCKLIVRCGVGVDNLPLGFARERGIPVANVPDYGTEEVADSAIGMTRALTRGTAYLNSRLRAGLGDWMYTQATPIRRLRGRTFVIVGLGRIGTATALHAKAIGFDVAFYDPYKPDGYDKALGVRRVESLGVPKLQR